ncbi:aspartate aminotransferase family protein [Brachybacterium squillarum]|uniref:aspartate aminotransferase family protein n=1 Tax=Brachybacterium squillarum TaxID=661979 RepID=UPI00026299AA|nr:aminotransferase class III-fold pyridoxal phosphate-dependent enzyme [Brachybacterium squillarum]
MDAPRIEANRAYHERLKQVLAGGVHYNFNMPWEEIPLHVASARGSRMIDLDGREYLDLYARFGANILGHRHPAYLAALHAALEDVPGVSHGTEDLAPALALQRHLPSAELVRFGLSGSEIVQMALRLARAHTGRDDFLRFVNHYHGNADPLLGGRVEDTRHPVPVEYRGDYRGTRGRAPGSFKNSWMIPWNDLEELETFFVRHGESLAAVLTEPVCVNGGSIEPVPGFLERLRELCTEHGVVLIFDEMITGLRMGLGGGQAHYGVTPDLTTLGKAIAGGALPVSALVGRAEIMAHLESKKVIHAGTFNGYPLGGAAVAETVGILEREEGAALTTMLCQGDEIGRVLTECAAEAGLPFIVQGPPGCASFHIRSAPLTDPRQYDFALMGKDIVAATALQRHGVLISSITRLYPNVQWGEEDSALLAERARPALVEARELIDQFSGTGAA